MVKRNNNRSRNVYNTKTSSCESNKIINQPKLTDTMNLNSLSSKFIESLQMLKSKQIGKIIALDCEMVGVGFDGLDSALARVSIVDINETVIFDTYVQASQPVVDYRTHISGITSADLTPENAMTFYECRSIVYFLTRGRVLVGHAIDNDLKVLGIQHPQGDIRDTATYLPFMRVDIASRDRHGSAMKRRKLRDLVREKLGDEIQQEGKAHSSVEDAFAALKLYKLARKEWETLLNWQKQKNGVQRNMYHSQKRKSSKSQSPTRTHEQRKPTKSFRQNHYNVMSSHTKKNMHLPQRIHYVPLSAS